MYTSFRINDFVEYIRSIFKTENSIDKTVENKKKRGWLKKKREKLSIEELELLVIFHLP